MFPTFYSRWQKCLVTQEDYFERNAVKMVVFFISQKYSDSGNTLSHSVSFFL
jgi:hypothetical protein